MNNSIGDAIRRAFIDLWSDVINFIPEFVAALVILILGYAFAVIAGAFVERIVHMFRVDTLADRMNIHNTLKKIGFDFSFSNTLGVVTKWFFIVVFLTAAVEVLGWTQIVTFLNDVVRYIPQVLIAIVILAVGLMIASVVEDGVTKTLLVAKTVRRPATLGAVAKWAIVIFSIMAALTQLRVAENLIAILFAGILLTFVISFGLAGKEHAQKFLDKLFV